MNEQYLKEYNEEQAEKKRLISIAELIYSAIREEYSPREIHGTIYSFIHLVNVHSEVANIARYIKCLCISECEPSETYEYSVENKYDPTFMDKFSNSFGKHFYTDITEELFNKTILANEPDKSDDE